MSAEKAGWSPRALVPGPVVERTGRVVAVEVGVVEVTRRGRRLRATAGAAMLQQIALDRAATPQVGDRVLLRYWADGHATVERVVARAVPATREPSDEPGCGPA